MVESEANTNAGEEALNRLRTTDPVQYLSPSPELSRLARAASSFLYLSLLPFCPTKPPLDQLLADEQFDAEQIWGQIDLLSKPLIPFLKRQINRLEKEPKPQSLVSPPLNITEEDESEEENNGELGEGESDEDDLEEEEGEEIEEDEEEEEEERKGVEDKFLRIKELEKFLEQGEAEEYGDLQSEKNGKDGSDVEEEDNDDDEEEEGFTFGGDTNDEDDEGEEANQAEYVRYEDFFGGNANKGTRERNSSKKKVHFEDELEDLELENQEDQEDQEDEDTDDANENDKKNLSTHEKEMQKLKSKVDQMEKANLEPKTWTMQGEVSAAKRPKNSALEVDLDFEHNTRPVPVITEEVTASIEEIIKKRIIDSKFDDVERAPALPVKAPRELKEMDETKSKKGLAELYEEDYTQKAGLAPAPLSSSDEIKKEADVLFKKICLKLDALSHFHFAPKPVIEDMSIQVNVPALAMEEIAPVAVSDAAMLAPEEIFEGKGDIKEDKELTQSERKRRRANKKRKFKARADKRAPKKPRNEAVETNGIIA